NVAPALHPRPVTNAGLLSALAPQPSARGPIAVLTPPVSSSAPCADAAWERRRQPPSSVATALASHCERSPVRRPPAAAHLPPVARRPPVRAPVQEPPADGTPDPDGPASPFPRAARRAPAACLGRSS